MKRLRLVGWSLLLACVLPVWAGRPDALTIATYNIQNYGPANRMTADGFRPSYPKPDEEKQALRQVLRAIDADVLVLQEMGPAEYLEELQRDLAAEGLDYPHRFLAVGADRERHVALLSRVPLRRTQTLAPTHRYQRKLEPVKRGVLHVELETSRGPVALFGLHLKSRRTERKDDPEAREQRAGEAAAVRDAVLKQFPDPSQARFLILGDLNDVKTSRALRLLQKRGNQRVCDPVPAFDSRKESWTYHYAREDTYSRIDYVLASPAVRPDVLGDGTIHDGPGVNEASDHRPVVVFLRK